MNEEQAPLDKQAQPEKWYAPLLRATPLSKYLALTLFVLLPFVGFLLGWIYGESEVEKNMQSSNSQALDTITQPSKVAGDVGQTKVSPIATSSNDKQEGCTQNSFIEWSESTYNFYGGIHMILCGDEVTLFDVRYTDGTVESYSGRISEDRVRQFYTAIESVNTEAVTDSTMYVPDTTLITLTSIIGGDGTTHTFALTDLPETVQYIHTFIQELPPHLNPPEEKREEECYDGESFSSYYPNPKGALEFSSGFSPSQDLRNVRIAYSANFSCLDSGEEGYFVKKEFVFERVSEDEFHEFIDTYNASCNQCLTEQFDGCCK